MRSPGAPVHTVFVTEHTEYHVRDGRCVGVRDRSTGGWCPQHAAAGREIMGPIRMQKGAFFVLHQAPEVGDRLCFEGGSLVTTPIVHIEGPFRDLTHDRAA